VLDGGYRIIANRRQGEEIWASYTQADMSCALHAPWMSSELTDAT